MLKLIRNGEVFAPEPLGKMDILVAGEKICAMAKTINLDDKIEGVELEIVEASGKYVFPGFIDTHVHITGGGGEGGFGTRTPEIDINDIIEGGISTIVGTLGTDGYGRTMPNLLAKAGGLNTEGITCYVNTGSYQVPVRTFTNSVSEDIMFIEKIMGAGEIAIADHRSSCPTIEELEKIISQVRVAAMLSGKRGIVNIHMGDEPECLDKIEEIIKKCKAYKKHLLPTHMNRSRDVFDRGLKYLSEGGFIDLTTSTTPQFIEEGEVACEKAIKEIINQGLDLSKVVMSSDGQGSLPIFDNLGHMAGIEIGRVTSLYEAVKNCILMEGIPIEAAIGLITSNPADIYAMKNKGRLTIGADADINIANRKTLDLETFICNGKIIKNIKNS